MAARSSARTPILTIDQHLPKAHEFAQRIIQVDVKAGLYPAFLSDKDKARDIVKLTLVKPLGSVSGGIEVNTTS